ncbi:MAG: T9SS type A sorting domain-containing protein, partial [Bacteroidota bacterium]
FDNNPEDYGVYTLGGSSFERGNSTEKGKNGTNSGDNAFVIGLEEEFYQRNTHTMLYLPNFDFSEKTIYEFSFWYKAALQVGFDGFLVEYSTDRGKSWRSLGSEQKTWYDSRVEDNGSGYAFPAGTAFFGRNKSKFEQAYLDISFLAGNPDVAFRFVFKSNDVGSHAGLVLDDVEIKKFNGKAETAIVNIQADYSEPSRIQIDWTTQPEYYAERFFLERSFNGKTFERVGNKVSPTGILTARTQNYEIETEGGRDLYFFRIRSINENSADGYYHEFTSPVVVVNRNKDEADLEALKIFPNPFVDAIEMTFTGVVEDDMTVQLFDMAGRLVYENTIAVAGIYTKIDINPLPAGAYVLRYKIGDRAAKTQKVNTNGEE